MSVTFSIKNRKKLFSYEEVLNVEEALNLVDELTQFSFDETDEEFDPSQFYQTPLSQFECLLVGIYKKSGRGFEIAYDEKDKSYNIRVNTPATSFDWELAILYMQELSRRLGSGITGEDGTKYSSENIVDFDYEHDILFGIKSFCGRAKGSGSILFGLLRPIYIKENLANRLLNSDNSIKFFDELVLKTQYLDAYAANQAFYIDQKDSSIFGNYTLSQNLPTILPYEPYIEYDNLQALKDKEVTTWKITFVCCDDEENPDSYYVLGEMDYDEFIKNLDEAQYSFIDDAYIVLDGLSKEQMQAHLN